MICVWWGSWRLRVLDDYNHVDEESWHAYEVTIIIHNGKVYLVDESEILVELMFINCRYNVWNGRYALKMIMIIEDDIIIGWRWSFFLML